MTKEEISVAAFNGVKPGGLSMPEELLFYRERDLYDDNRSGKVSPSDGKKKKAMLERQFDLDVQKVQQDDALIERTVKLWKNIEQTASQYRLNPTADNADKLYRAIYSMKEGQ